MRLPWPRRQLALVCGRGAIADTLVERLDATRKGGRADLAAALRAAPAQRKVLIAAVDEDDAENAWIVEAVTDVLLERPRRRAPVRIVAFAEDPELRAALQAREKVRRDGEAAPQLRLDLLAPAEACARRLLAVSLLEASADTEDGAALHLLVLGADDFA